MGLKVNAEAVPPWAKPYWWGVDEDTGCWVWLMAKNPKGYGYVGVAGKTKLAHRHVYTMLRGPIPDGLELDHLCRNRACVNPDHLEAVTHRENIRRGNVGTKPGTKRPPLNRWSRHWERCIDCGRTDRRHAEKGRCSACRKRYHRAIEKAG